MNQTINFYEHKIKAEGGYKCKCGYRFKRISTSCWTENPYNKRWMEGKIDSLNKEAKEENTTYLKMQKCPKCDAECNKI